MPYQYGSDLGDRGPFNAEKVWSLSDPDQPAYVVPPLAHITTGPSGLCFNYGATALPERYRDHFFVCDFQGASSRSGVYSFAVKPRGAAFELVDGHEFIKGILATDCDFGPDGAFYVSDWVNGWYPPGKGRLYRFVNTEAASAPVIAETKGLLAEGFAGKSPDELATLLGHADQRVRQEAQFALADRGAEAIPVLAKAAKESANPLARLHAVWGLGQVGRKTNAAEAFEPVLALTADRDADLRAQAARVLGDAPASAVGTLVKLAGDREARVRLQAALSLRRQAVTDDEASREVVAAAVRLLRENAGADAYLRHAAVMILSECGSESAVVALAGDESPAVRLGVLVALRRRHGAAVSRFLGDADAHVATEAARAIHDEPITEALPQLAAMLDRPKAPELLLWRALNARFCAGRSEDAAAVAQFAANAAVPERLRVEAARMLGAWANPGRRDRVTGMTQDLGAREAKPAADALRAHLPALLAGPDDVLAEAAAAAGGLGIAEVAPQMLDLARDTKRAPGTRVAALRALAAVRDQHLKEATRLALDDADPRVRAEGRRLLAMTNPTEGVAALEQALDRGEVIEKQLALAALGEIKGAEADAALVKGMEKLLAGDYPAELRVDLLEAAETRNGGTVRERLKRFEDNRPKDDPLANYREALVGGDAEAGRRLFLTRTEYSCLRCHKLKGEGGDVGPDLAGIGARQKREYLLESIVDPDKQIAQGFESVIMMMKNGIVYSGMVKAENDRELKLMTADGTLTTVAKDKIEKRDRSRSAMPENLVRSKRDLRDLVEFLASLK
jgi:quinoprotein glucose dehydrogenase